MTHDQTTPASVEVTQADREAAQALMDRWEFGDLHCDDFVEAFARHRLAHSAPAGEVEPVFIWSGEHNAYWRTGGNGYTVRASKAGIWTREEAVRQTIHCGPEKRIELEPVAVPTHPAPPADLVELVEAAWRAGFQTARDCLPDDADDVLTEDVEHDQWLDSNTRAALAKHGGA